MARQPNTQNNKLRRAWLLVKGMPVWEYIHRWARAKADRLRIQTQIFEEQRNIKHLNGKYDAIRAMDSDSAAYRDYIGHELWQRDLEYRFLLDKKVIMRARALDISIPNFNDDSFFEKEKVDYDMIYHFIREDKLLWLRGEIKKEEKYRREAWVQRVTIATGFIGSLIGLYSIYKS